MVQTQTAMADVQAWPHRIRKHVLFMILASVTMTASHQSLLCLLEEQAALWSMTRVVQQIDQLSHFEAVMSC